MSFFSFDCGCQFDRLEYESLRLDCPKVWDLLAKGLTLGVFQLDSPLGRKWARRLKPRSVEHLAALTALLRPSCLESLDDQGVNITEHYCRRANNEELVEYFHPALKPILANTYGTMIFQEQALHIARDIAGFNLQEADSLRKGIGKKSTEIIAKIKSQFVDRAEQFKVVNRNDAEQIFSWIEKAQRYQFNRCLSYDTVIRRPTKSKNSFTYNIEEAYKIRNDINYAKKTGHLELYKKWKFYNSYRFGLSMCEDGRIRPNEILDIQFAGVRPVLKIVLENGSFIRVTSNHKFPTIYGELLASDLKIGDNLYICGEYEKGNGKRYGYSNVSIKELRERQICHDGREGFMEGSNNPSYTGGAYTEWKQNKKLLPMFCFDCQAIDCRLEVHHVDGDRTNSKLDNLVRLCVSCHKKREYKSGRVKRGDKGYPSLLVPIREIIQEDECNVYDVTMTGPNHNFVIDNGIITSNSHAVSYGIKSYESAYIKSHFPLHFYKWWLSLTEEKSDAIDQVRDYIHDAKMFDISILPPDLRKIKKSFFIDSNSSIRFGFIDVKGIGESSLEQLKQAVWESEKICYKSIRDFTWYEILLFVADRMGDKLFSKLISVGALDFVGLSRSQMLKEHRLWGELTPKERNWLLEKETLAREIYYKGDTNETITECYLDLNDAMKALAPIKKNGGGTSNRNRAKYVGDLTKLLDETPLGDNPLQIIIDEEELLGVPLTVTKLDNVEVSMATHTCRDLFDKKCYGAIAAEIKDVKIYVTKTGKNEGKERAILSLVDKSGVLDSVNVFAEAHELYRDMVYSGNTCLFMCEPLKYGGYAVKKMWAI